MKVREIMTNNVASNTTSCTIDAVAKKMKELNVGSIPICDNANNVVGIATDRDIVIRGICDGLQPSDNIGKVMTNQLISISPEAHAHEAAKLMAENQIRRLPVVENGKLVGVLSIGDLAVQNIYENEAGSALSDISTPCRPTM